MSGFKQESSLEKNRSQSEVSGLKVRVADVEKQICAHRSAPGQILIRTHGGLEVAPSGVFVAEFELFQS
jgi:hypothetical protein